MALLRWTTPRTWSTGEDVTSSLLNVQVRDNMRYLYNRNFGGAVSSNTHETGTFAVSAAGQAVFLRNLGSGTIVAVRFNVAAQDGQLCIGIYSSSGTGTAARPSTRLAWTAAQNCPAVGDAILYFDVPVTVGDDHWWAVACSSTSAELAGWSVGGLRASSLFAGTMHYQSSAFPLPATTSLTNYGGPGFPQLVGISQ